MKRLKRTGGRLWANRNPLAHGNPLLSPRAETISHITKQYVGLMWIALERVLNPSCQNRMKWGSLQCVGDFQRKNERLPPEKRFNAPVPRRTPRQPSQTESANIYSYALASPIGPNMHGKYRCPSLYIINMCGEGCTQFSV